MPRDGSGIYSKASANVAPNTVIQSSVYNADMADFVADANAVRPAVAGGTGTALGAMPPPDPVAKAAGTYSAGASDNGDFWRFTGTGTVNLGAAATLASKWCLWVRANGGSVTIDPSGAELIDGAATIVLADGQTVLIVCTGTAFFTMMQGTAGGSIDPGRLFGLALTTNVADATNDIDIAVGSAASDDTDPVKMVLAAALGKRLDAAWAVGGTPGTAAGGLDTGAVGNSTYYVWLIRRPDTGVVDALFSLSATAPTMPTSYTQKRQLGWFARAAGVNSTTMNAALGALGEVISASVASGAAVTLTTGTPKTITSISLTAGDWDVHGNLGFFPGATTSITRIVESISLVNDALDSNEGNYAADIFAATVPGASASLLVMAGVTTRISIASTTTVYLVAQSVFTVAGNTAYGKIWARRAR